MPKVAYQGAMTIQGIDAARMQMIEALCEGDRIEVDCSQVAEVDLCFIQMLLAARLGAEQVGKTVRLSAPADGAMRAALERGGFVDPRASIVNPLWAGE